MPISEIALRLGIPKESLYPYGSHIAKVDSRLLPLLKERPEGRLVLVTAMSPTPAGEGKTTLAIGLTQALKLLGKKTSASIRQPSLGPVFGAKGGATGGGASMAEPAQDITFQFTGDDYAIVTAHNLISSLIDNHIHYGNRLNMDTDRILWKRVSTVNDRALRSVRVSLGRARGERDEEFHISAASELMSILCLSQSLAELKKRASDMLVAFNKEGGPVFVRDLKAEGAVAALLKRALSPNLVQSTEGVPIFVHGGPFGNISIGCSSLISIRMALRLSEFVLTEAGFATDLGAEKFFNILCRTGSLRPSCVVLVATLRALRFHGGSADYKKSDPAAMRRGMENLRKHIENIRAFGVPLIVAINRFSHDDESEIDAISAEITSLGVRSAVTDVFGKGGEGGLVAARAIIDACTEACSFDFLYTLEEPVKEKVLSIAKAMYGAAGVHFTPEACSDMEKIERLGLGGLPVCIAKTPKSLSDDPALTGRPRGFSITVSRVRPATGARYIVATCGQILLMPGLPERARAEEIDVDDEGNITGI